jgi:3-ketosteroid 9alpha-monooxygenase subunit B
LTSLSPGLELRVAEVFQESPQAISIVFDVPDSGVEHFQYLPGQFLTLRVPSERDGSVARCYSLSSSPHTEDTLAVTVKRTEGGYASNWLCDNIESGMILAVLPPAGHFTPRDLDRDMVLFAAGSGITPIMSIIKSALAEGSGHITLFYANQDSENVIFGPDLAHYAKQYSERLDIQSWLESEQGLPTADVVKYLCSAHRNSEFFVCGPPPFMDLVVRSAESVNVTHDRIHREVFQSLHGNPFEVKERAKSASAEDSAQAIVYLNGEKIEIAWPRDLGLLDALLNEDYSPPYSCKEGSCGACVCRLLQGDVAMLANDILVAADIAEGERLACQALPLTDEVTVTFDI